MDAPTVFESSSPVRLTVVVGWGPFGAEVASELNRLLPALSDPLLHAASVHVVGESEDVAESLNSARSALVSLENTERIRRAGRAIDGETVDRPRVRHWVVWDRQEIGHAPSGLSDIIVLNPTDFFAAIVGGVTDGPLPPGGDWPVGLRPFSLGPTLATGEQISRADVVRSVAGLLFGTLLPSLAIDLDVPPKRAGTFGFSAAVGLSGASLQRLGEHLAQRVLTVHLDSAHRDRGGSLPAVAADLIEEHDPRRLGERLFDPRQLPRLRPEPIPAQVKWNEHSELDVKLGGGALGLQLAAHEPHAWSQRLRELSRAFDLTVAFRWRRQLELAARIIAAEIRRTFVPRCVTLLDSLPFSPTFVEEALATLEDRLSAERKPIPDRSNDLERVLHELDARVAALPNPLALALRMALWTIPLLTVGASVVHAWYLGSPRALFLPVIFVVVVAVGAIAGVLLRLVRSHQHLANARARAIGVVVARQEAFLSGNAMACLDEVLRELRGQLGVARQSVAAYRETARGALSSLEASVHSDLASSLTMDAVLTRPSEYRDTADHLQPQLEEWLKDAAKAGILSPPRASRSPGDAWAAALADWCAERVQLGTGMRAPTFAELWEIRRKHRDSGTLEECIGALVRRAVPLSRAPIRGGPIILAVPPSMGPQVAAICGADRNLSGVQVREITEIEAFICLRTAMRPEPV